MGSERNQNLYRIIEMKPHGTFLFPPHHLLESIVEGGNVLEPFAGSGVRGASMEEPQAPDRDSITTTRQANTISNNLSL